MNGQLKIKPVSINEAYRGGRRFKTKEYLKYENDILWQLKGRPQIKGNYRLWLNFYLKNASRCDVSNYIKCLEDIFVKAGLVEDDRYCTEIHVTKIKHSEDIINWHIENVVAETKE